VYDALNVLMAMDIIRKDKKEIRWVGLPTSSLQELRELDVPAVAPPQAENGREQCSPSVCLRGAAVVSLQRERKERLHAINVKKAHLQELLLHVRDRRRATSPVHTP